MADRRVVIVKIEGGCVTEVEQALDADVHIIDLDTEGADTDALCDCAMGDVPHFHAEYPGDPEKEAAPELLAALEEVIALDTAQLTARDWGIAKDRAYSRARAAIAKARPQAP